MGVCASFPQRNNRPNNDEPPVVEEIAVQDVKHELEHLSQSENEQKMEALIKHSMDRKLSSSKQPQQPQQPNV